MKTYKQRYTRKFFVYALLWFLLTWGSYQVLADEPPEQTTSIIPDGEIQIILDLIGNQTRDNYERIVTWSGEIDVKLSRLLSGVTAEDIFRNVTDAEGDTPETILQKTEEKVVFAIDADKNFIYIDNFREEPAMYFSADGTDIGNQGARPYRSTLIVKPDFQIKAKTKSFKDNKIYHKEVVKKPSLQKLSTGLYKGINDPRKTFMPGGNPWRHYDILIKKLNRYGKIEFDGYEFKMEECRKGEITEYKITEPSVVSMERKSPEHYIVTTKTFSSQYGFNIIQWEVNSGNGMSLQKFSWEYELLNNIYVPKKVVEKHYDSNGKVTLERNCTYIKNTLNQEIPPEKFEYTNLNLKEGDIFIDEILDEEYRYEAATQTLKPVRSQNSSESK